MANVTTPRTASPALLLPGKPFRVVVTSTSSFDTTVVVWQSAGAAQAGLSAPPGTRVLTRLPDTLAVALSFTLAALPAARPAGTLHVTTLPTGTAHVTGATGVSSRFARPAGTVSLRVATPVLGPVPVLRKVKVHVSVSPTLAAVLSTVLLARSKGELTVLVVLQSPGCRHTGLSVPLALAPLTRLPAATARAVTCTVAAPPAARPAGTLHVSTLPASGAHVVGAAGATAMSARPAGRVSVTLATAVLAPVPLFARVSVQLRLSPMFRASLSTLFFRARAGLVMVVFVWQLLAWKQAGLSGPLGMTWLARLPPALALPVSTIWRWPLPAASWPLATLQLCWLFATQLASGGHVTPLSGVTAVTTILAGNKSVRITAPWLARLPVLLAVIVQMISSPTFATLLLAVLLTRMMEPGMVTVATFGWSFATSVEVVAMRLTTVDRLLAGWT